MTNSSEYGLMWTDGQIRLVK